MDIVREEPRGGGDVAIPRPDCLVGMTVVAAAPEDRPHLGWRRDFRVDRRIAPIDRDELDENEGCQADDQCA
jgi:hypothetical protein